jgi:predicted dehydrogenase
MIRVGIIGMGIRGRLYGRAVLQNPDAELVGFAEINPKVIKEAEEFFKIKGVSDYKELLNKGLDAVIIATPDFAHAEPVLEAIRRGYNVMIEKPIAMSVKEAEAIVEEASKKGIKGQVAFENRWNAPFVMVRESIKNGEFGDIYAMRVTLNDTIYVPTRMISWAGRSSPGWFLLSHCVDMALWLLEKKAKRVDARGIKKVLKGRGIDTYDAIDADIMFEDGSISHFFSSWILPESMPFVAQFKFEIYGEKGYSNIDFSNSVITNASEKYYFAGLPTLWADIHNRITGAPVWMLDSFIDCIKNDKPVIASLEEGLEVTKIIAAMHRAIEEEKEIEISL